MSSNYETFKRDEESDFLLPSGRFVGDRVPRQRNHRSPLGYFLLLCAVLSVLGVVYLNNFGGWSQSSSSETSGSNFDSSKSANLKSSPNKKPNFLVIIADDLGFSSLGYNQYDIAGSAPFLTELIKDGIMFTNYYAQEECTPSRAALLTGRYPITTGMQYHVVQPSQEWGLDTSEILLPSILKEYGNYKNYGIGKWHLGHHTPDYLPTARGFDQFLGYLTGEIFYWTKRLLQWRHNYDLLYMDDKCYDVYNSSDFSNYTTFLFTSKATDVIENHDFEENPMFMYLPFQAVHNPFDDTNHTSGIDSTLVPLSYYTSMSEETVGTTRMQYALTLYLLDQAVEKIVDSLKSVGQLDNTYIIFSSDNGGCYESGGRNGDLRGSKGSLYEGGIKVDSFIYSPLLPVEVRGTNYSGLTHISDWFPTILELAGIEYTATPEHKLDGVSQATAMKIGESANSRTNLLYNLYYNVEGFSFDLSTNGSFAIRDTRYKLMHAYDSNPLSEWYDFSSTMADDDNLDSGTCTQSVAMMGTYSKYLFDLQEDPNETNNLYMNSTYDDIKDALYSKVNFYAERTASDPSPVTSTSAYAVWSKHYHYIVPWSDAESTDLTFCTPSTFFK